MKYLVVLSSDEEDNADTDEPGPSQQSSSSDDSLEKNDKSPRSAKQKRIENNCESSESSQISTIPSHSSDELPECSSKVQRLVLPLSQVYIGNKSVTWEGNVLKFSVDSMKFLIDGNFNFKKYAK